MTRWWKCDLQVATPGARDFRGPSDPPWDLQTLAGRQAAAARYMRRLCEVGIEVVALADHNDASWVETMAEAGQAAGVTVFPGIEITTGSGSDGIHLIVIGEPGTQTSAFDEILAATCGFSSGVHPRFDPVHGTPASSPRTLIDILDELPAGFLAIAPHAFNDNGIASETTIRGDLRWKVLHHPRLAALDVGDARNILNAGSWRARFVRRELTDFPVLPDLAFVSTSDAYALQNLGSRWTWIRMASPTSEALRQAFLDHEARIVCDWDGRFPGQVSPNEVNHAWVESVKLKGLNTADEPVFLDLDPRLNVIIGGRGSGKSSIVAALRCLYGDADGLPPQAQTEYDDFVSAVFPQATIEARHHLPHSGEAQTAQWTAGAQSLTLRGGESDGDTKAPSMSTDFKVRVINQKELFERASHSATDPHATSRSLLRLVDDALARGSSGPGGPSAFAAELQEAQTAWISAARAHQSELEITSQRDLVAARIAELERQVEAFDSPPMKARRKQNDSRSAQNEWFEASIEDLEKSIERLENDLTQELSQQNPIPVSDGEIDLATAEGSDLGTLVGRLDEIRTALRTGIQDAVHQARTDLGVLDSDKTTGAWHLAVAAALVDAGAYLEELRGLGIDPEAFERVRVQLGEEKRTLADLDRRLERLPVLGERANHAWSAIEVLLDGRRENRKALLDDVAQRSELLRFRVTPCADVTAWVQSVRDLLNLRADGFLTDVPSLSAWLWTEGNPDEQRSRALLWRAACITGDFSTVATAANMRRDWQDRLSYLDDILRARIGAEVAEDAVAMEFLREGGDTSVHADWKPLTSGSPGQRSAAMLSFVLHHGVEPLVLDQPEDDLDTEWITQLVVRQLRMSRWTRQLVVVTHNANIPVNADAERVIVMESHLGGIRVRRSGENAEGVVIHAGALEQPHVRRDIQQIMEGGVAAFVRRERRYNNELNIYRASLRALTGEDPAEISSG